MKISFNSFANYSAQAEYSNIPIKYLSVFREISKITGKYYKLRYRGPRNTPADAFPNRNRNCRQSTCLKQNAVTFSAYEY
jgi:hypothetical protein